MHDRSDDAGFLSRWSQRKARVREGQPVAEAAALLPVDEAAADMAVVATAPAAPAAVGASDAPVTPPDVAGTLEAAPLTLDDVALLTHESDYSRFVASGVDGGVRNAALHKLFSDPRFNIMDGLDTYIDDYSQPDPLPPGMLQRMFQSEALGLFKNEASPQAVASPLPPAMGGESTSGGGPTLIDDHPQALALPPPAPTESQVPDEDPDLRLQPHDAAGHEGAEPGPDEDPAGQR
jgi:hypothetical protein